MKQEEDKFTGLPENAFRELKPGEVYNPLMSPKKTYPEVNLWSVAWGIAMAILFSAAAAYLGLKVGQVFEAAIPIAIIAVGVSGAAKRKNALGENVIIQSIGACSGVIVAGAIFTLPALYILQAKYPDMSVTFMQVFISSLLGGVLGILFLIPFRKYFVSDMHGKYPFPEATATTQVLVSGEKGGSQAKPLLMAGLIGGLYDFIVATFGWWNENFTTRVCGVGEMLADKAKLVFKVNTGAAVLGLGYIVGLKYASIICFGSLAVWWIIVPGMSLFFGDSVLNQWNPDITATVGSMSPEQIFSYYAKSIGIGGIAMAGRYGGCRVERPFRHGGFIGNGWCGLYRTFHGRRFYHRLENRILARQHTGQAGSMEVPRNHRFGCYRRRCNDYPEQNLRIHKRSAGCPAG